MYLPPVGRNPCYTSCLVGVMVVCICDTNDICVRI